MKFTKVFAIHDYFATLQKDGKQKYKYIIHSGSSRSSKTISIIQWLNEYCLNNPKSRVTVWRDTKESLKHTVWSDFRKFYSKDHNFTKHTTPIFYDNGSTFEPHGADSTNAHGLTQNIAWLNEPYKVTKETFDQIDQRADLIIIDLNPKQGHWSDDLMKNERAVTIHSTYKDNPFKTELIENLEDGSITFCTHDNFTDLCRGGHLPDTSPVKAVKILNAAGAYWRGDEKNKQLTRVYGISFPKQKDLKEYLHNLEEAKKRDHRKLGKELGIFTFSEKVGAGLPLWLPKGTALRKKLENFLSEAQRKGGYEFVMTPHIGSVELYKTSGHYEKYGEDSFQPIKTPNAGEEFMLKPMNCPHHCEIYKSSQWSYRDLPKRYAEFGTVYRYEQSGELHGLTRVRGFTQDDAHLFCTPDQLLEEFKKVIDLVLYVFGNLGFEDFVTQVSLRDPENKQKYIGSDENWEKAESAIIKAAKEKGLKTIVEYGEAAFYGPKLDFMVKDALGRSWQLGTIQVDYNLPERFDLTYIGSDGEKHRPVMIHRAPFGSMERFVAILIEHTAGNFPMWLAPEQFTILPISDKYLEYSKKVLNLLENSDIRGIIDDRSEKTGKKIRDAEVSKIPYMLIVGEKEEENGTVSVRKHGEGDLGTFTIEEFKNRLQNETLV